MRDTVQEWSQIHEYYTINSKINGPISRREMFIIFINTRILGMHVYIVIISSNKCKKLIYSMQIEVMYKQN